MSTNSPACKDCGESTEQVVYHGTVGDLLGCRCTKEWWYAAEHNALIQADAEAAWAKKEAASERRREGKSRRRNP